MFDFGNFRKPDQRTRPTDPREIWKRRPAGEGAANDLWQGQAEALGKWFEDQKDESLILLNTGAGKTIIGLLIAQSYVHQGLRNVVYACSTSDLVRQTAREATKLGLSVTCRVSQKFDNELFSQGRAFCITTYQALLNYKTLFKGQLKPGAVIFDDAHVANRTIREIFTIQIKKKDKPSLFATLVEQFRPAFSDSSQKMELQALLREDSTGSTVLLVPPCAVLGTSDSIAVMIDKEISDDEADLMFPWLYLRDHLKFCAWLIRNDMIEITPPFLPTLILPAFARDVKRVFLSATITTEADFTRVFGRKPQLKIAPDVDAGNGERLFIFSSKLGSPQMVSSLVERITKSNKVLIAVPSKKRGIKWSELAEVPDRSVFSDELDRFRRAKTGAFILAGRFDGIDLPGSQCRVMVVDSLPSGTSLIEQYLFDRLQMDHLHSNTLSVRLTQLLGRIIRGRQDYGFLIIADRNAENWPKNERNRSLMPELLRRQLFLSEEVETRIPGRMSVEMALETMNKVLNRSSDWIEFYRDTLLSG